jgi:hypothetical protein
MRCGSRYEKNHRVRRRPCSRQEVAQVLRRGEARIVIWPTLDKGAVLGGVLAPRLARAR